MLRNNTESFAINLWKFLNHLGIEHKEWGSEGSQLMKFDRLTPDVFAWLLRNDSTYLVTISDRPGDHPSNEFLAKQWLGGKLSVDDIQTLSDNEGNMYLKDDFDTVVIRKLPDTFDLDTEDLYYEA